MRRRVLALSALLLGIALPAATAEAQADRRKGFWVALGAGGGYADPSCSAGAATLVCLAARNPDSDTFTGVGVLRLGGTLSRSLLLGAEFRAFAYGIRDAGAPVLGQPSGELGTITVGHALLTLTAYPWPEQNLFVKGGLGFGTATAEERVGGLRLVGNSGGLAGLVGVGYDVRLSRRLSLTPAFDLYGGRLGGIEGAAPGFRSGMAAFTVALTLH